jgi:hypothetical protein
MKILNLILTTILFSALLTTACKKDDINEVYNYTYNNDYIRDTILYHINLRTIGNRHLFVVNEYIISEAEINNKISSVSKDDIISITIIDKSDALEIYGSSAKDGVVKLNYYIDPLLKPEYYVTQNIEIMKAIDDIISQGKVVRYPLIVIDGKPLRGTEIKEYLDNLNNESIKSISVMNLQSGLQLFGERAINGVVIINTLYD